MGQRTLSRSPQLPRCIRSFGLLRDKSIYAHCIYLDDADRARMTSAGATPSFCPTSNLFIGSGLYDLKQALEAGNCVSIGTDVGGGTSYSMLRTLGEAYKVQQLQGDFTVTSVRALPGHVGRRQGAVNR